MRTYIFKDYLNDKHGKFLPLQTIESEDFGRHFFIDVAFEFISAPSLKSGGYDEQQLDYVSNWTDLEGVSLDKLLNIHRFELLLREEFKDKVVNSDFNLTEDVYNEVKKCYNSSNSEDNISYIDSLLTAGIWHGK